MDYMLKYTSHVIVLNSLVAIHKSLVSRSKTRLQQQQQQQQQLQQQQAKAASSADEKAAAAAGAADSEQVQFEKPRFAKTRQFYNKK